MNSPRSLSLSLIALVVLAFGLAAWLQPQFQQLPFNSQSPGDFWGNLLDDSRYLFANSAYVTADEYYHSGFYPTIFDNSQAFTTPHMAEDTGAVASRNSGDETGFMGPPRDWIDAFGRHFIPNRHTHLDEGGPTGDLSTSSKVSEILPWLKLSAELDPETSKRLWSRRSGCEPGLIKPAKRNKCCARGCAPIRGTRNCCLSWGAFISRVITTSRAREQFGRRHCGPGAPRPRTNRSPTGSR